MIGLEVPDEIDGVPVLRGMGRIRLTGEGPGLAARRDVADAIHRGDLRGVSLTWTAKEDDVKQRRALPKTHPAHVSRTERDARKRHGRYFERSTAIEQSIVAIPSDRLALIGRADAATDDEVRELWQTVTQSLDDTVTDRRSEIITALEGEVADLQERLAALTAPESAPPPSPMRSIDDVLAVLHAETQQAENEQRAAIRKSLDDLVDELTGRYRHER